MDERGPELGESFVTADDIRNGDLVRWDRGADGRILLRRVEPSELDSTPGPVFRLEHGEEPLSFALIPVQ